MQFHTTLGRLRHLARQVDRTSWPRDVSTYIGHPAESPKRPHPSNRPATQPKSRAAEQTAIFAVCFSFVINDLLTPDPPPQSLPTQRNTPPRARAGPFRAPSQHPEPQQRTPHERTFPALAILPHHVGIPARGDPARHATAARNPTPNDRPSETGSALPEEWSRPRPRTRLTGPKTSRPRPLHPRRRPHRCPPATCTTTAAVSGSGFRADIGDCSVRAIPILRSKFADPPPRFTTANRRNILRHGPGTLRLRHSCAANRGNHARPATRHWSNPTP